MVYTIGCTLAYIPIRGNELGDEDCHLSPSPNFLSEGVRFVAK